MAVTPLWHQWRLPYIRIASSFITSPRFSPYFLAPCCRALLPKHLTARNYVARLANPRRSLCNGHHRDGKVGNLVNCRASRISTFTTEDSPSSSTSPAASRTLLDGTVWAEVESWVVFSDLHLSRRTSDICLQVLQTIHAEAFARKAGIVFLGDFWHARGALPVELLNMAITELQSWQRPAIFIPGNHDQVNLGGQVHALQVLEAANPCIKVLSSPVEYLGALWLPFRRDHTFIEQAVQQHGSVQAIFAHVDVVGAFLNEECQAKEGIEPSIFPSDLPVYTGHYHKPHVVKGTQIEYVGSPYQVSAGESNQEKHFLLLDKKWQKIGEIPVDLGPRHFVISQNEGPVPEFGQSIREGDRVRWHLPSNTLDKGVKNQLVSDAPAALMPTKIFAPAGLNISDNFKVPSNRRTLSTSVREFFQLEYQSRTADFIPKLKSLLIRSNHSQYSTCCPISSEGHNKEELQRRGALVDLVFPIVLFKQRIKKAEHLDAFGLFELYAQSVDMKENVTNLATDMLRGLNLPAKLLQRPQVHCELKSVELEGFGAFLGPIKYPLAERGVRVVSGRNLDSSGADSNGAGKTTLVMAPLWALTGSTDARPDSVRGLTASEVVHHDAKRARVQVDGTINGTPFTVERIAGRKSGLKFTLDGEDQTCQEIRMTQYRIDELIDTSVLYRTVFQGQHGGGGLLEASDKDFKEELSRYMAMEVWAAVKEHSMKALRNKKTEIEQLEGALRQIAKQHQQLIQKVDMCLLRLQGWEDNRSKQVTTIEAELITGEKALHNVTTNIGHKCAQVMSTMSAWEIMGKELEQALQDGVESWSPLKQEFEKEKTSKQESFENLLQRQAEVSHQVKTACTLVDKRMKMLEAFQNNVAGSTVCDKCLQPIDPSHSSQSLLQLEVDLATSRQEHQRSQEEYKKGEKDVDDARKVMELKQKARDTEVMKLQEAQEAFRMSSATFLNKLNRVRQRIASAQMVLNNATPLLHAAQKNLNDLKSSGGQFMDESLTAKMDDFAEREGMFLHLVEQLEVDVKTGHSGKNQVEKLRTKFHMFKLEKNPYQAEFEVLSSLCAKAASEHQEKESLLGSLQEDAWSLKEIDTAFGLTGVQSYILEGALAEVQERTARYLEMLSGGSLGLLLRPTKVTKSSKVVVEAIEKIAVVRLSNGNLDNRSLRQLSGGERRRMALALALGYSEFASQRGGVHCNLLVLDEVLQHLDGEGQARVVSMLKGLPQSTVLVVSQAHTLLACSFDLVDWVIKQQDSATVEVAEESMQ